MSILSITFHTTDKISENWENYIQNELHQMVENLMDVDKYVISQVQSDLVSEGQNTNVLLIFDNDEKREDFVEIELKNITERMEGKFGDEVMIFQTFLNPIKTRL